MKDVFLDIIRKDNEKQFKKENNISLLPHAVKAGNDAPERLEIADPENVKRTKSVFKAMKMAFFSFPYLKRSLKDVNISLDTLTDNSDSPLTAADDSFITHFKEYAFSLGIKDIGFTKIKTSYIFKNKAVLYPNVIIFSKEMNRKIIETAPSLAGGKHVFQTYALLGDIANKLTEYLRKNGFGAQAGPALGGLSIYPVLAQDAGLGTIGRSGILISPDCGPVQRLATVYTSIENLPENNNIDHRQVKDFCRQCGKCLTACPVNAIYNKEITHDTGLKTFIDKEKCLDSMQNNYGCSVCLKVCPLNTMD